MAKVFATVKAIITRIIFSAHGFLAIWQVSQSKRDPIWWSLCTPIGLLFLEGIFTLTIKKNQEWRWFCPSVFLYLSSVVPAIWLLELNKMERRLKMVVGEDVALRPPNFKELDKILGNQLKLPEIRVDSGTWITLIEQFLMLILIIGRWMLPKGDLTRDQLSQLLLVYIGTAADIIEFFDSFKDNTIANDRLLVYLTLGIWSWSLMQFTIVLSATRARKSRGATTTVNYSESTNCCSSIDAWGIVLNIILQDAPFLAFRLLIIIHYKIISYMNVFFACKNTLVILLQLYRLIVVHSETRKAHKTRKLKNQRQEIYSIPEPKRRSRNKRRGHQDPVETKKGHKKRNHSSRRKDTGYSTAESSTATSTSSSSPSPVVMDVKKHRHKSEGRDSSTKAKKKNSSSRSHEKEPISNKKKKQEKFVEEEGTTSNSESEVAVVVEVVKEKKNKRRKHRKSSTSESENSE